MEQPPAPTSDRSFAEAPPPATGGDVFDLGFTPPAAPARRGGDDLFALDIPAPRPSPAAPAPVAPATPAVAAAPAVPAPVAEEPEPEGVVFPGLGSRESRSRYLNALAAEGLFGFEPVPEAAAPLPSMAPAVPVDEAHIGLLPPLDDPGPPSREDFERARTAPEPEPEPEPPVFDLEETTPWAAEPAPLFSAPEPVALAEEPVFAAEPEPAPAVEPFPEPFPEPAATATLGEIYLRQGHLGEAKRIFDEVLRREPDNPAAHEGLLHLASRRQERRPLEGRDLLAGYEPGEEGGEVEAKARKAFLLNSYLTRLRRGGQRDVS
jgi:hypothetical protein